MHGILKFELLPTFQNLFFISLPTEILEMRGTKIISLATATILSIGVSGQAGFSDGMKKITTEAEFRTLAVNKKIYSKWGVLTAKKNGALVGTVTDKPLKGVHSPRGDLKPPPDQRRCRHRGLQVERLPYQTGRPDEGDAPDHG